MRRSVGVFVLCFAMLAIPGLGLTTARAAGAPNHSIAVTGSGLDMYPAFSTDVPRYGLTTDADTGGTVTVHATTSDSSGRVLVDGREAPGGSATVDGLTDGDEISVIFEDSGGTS